MVLCQIPDFMPYMRNTRRRYTRRRPYTRRRRRTGRRKPMTAYRVRRIINAELKFAVNGIGPTPVPSPGGAIVPITENIIVGTGVSERIGNWIKPVNLHGTIVIKGNEMAAGAQDSFLLRCGFFLWKNDISVDVPTASDIMFDVGAPFGPLSIVDKGSFKQLWGRKVLVSNDNDNPKFFVTLPYYLKLRNQQTLYNAGTAKKYQIFFFIIADSVGLNQPFYQIDFTLRYTDS